MDCQEEADVEQQKNCEDGFEVHKEEECCVQRISLHRIRIVGSTAFIECSYATKRRD